MSTDWTVLVAIAAVAVSALAIFSKSMDKGLSIREHEVFKAAVERDIRRIEERLQLIEQTHPTTGELEILAEGINKRIDTIHPHGRP